MILRGVTKKVSRDQAVLLFLRGRGCWASLALEAASCVDLRGGAASQDF